MNFLFPFLADPKELRVPSFILATRSARPSELSFALAQENLLNNSLITGYRQQFPSLSGLTPVSGSKH